MYVTAILAPDHGNESLATQIITGYIVADIYQPFWLQVARASRGY